MKNFGWLLLILAVLYLFTGFIRGITDNDITIYENKENLTMDQILAKNNIFSESYYDRLAPMPPGVNIEGKLNGTTYKWYAKVQIDLFDADRYEKKHLGSRTYKSGGYPDRIYFIFQDQPIKKIDIKKYI